MERTAYPRPQFVRNEWQNLNGLWEFCFDDENKGLEERWYLGMAEFELQIQVPFAYQCQLSGISDKKKHEILWYKKSFQVDRTTGERVWLHFGAVDYSTKIFLNGSMICEHEGGHTPFSVDITDFLQEGEQVLVLRVYDPLEDELIPRGKQFWEEKPRVIWYTGTSGIWQTIWLEKVNCKYISDVKFTALFDDGKESIICQTEGTNRTDAVVYQIYFKGEMVCEGEIKCHSHLLKWDVDLMQNHIFRTNFHGDGWAWTPESPNLFDVVFLLKDADGQIQDRVESYFGFRKIHRENGRVYLNNRPYYMRLVLDQGYWPEGLLTAPTDEALKRDIELSKAMGFNGCRKHQKMEDPIFLYWADKLGYLVWGECASAIMYDEKTVKRLMTEWSEIVERDYNHPSIVVWVPFNESWGIPNVRENKKQQHFSQMMYHFLHALDDTRLVISNDGWELTETDICGIHNYAHGQKEETEKFAFYKEMLSDKEHLLKILSASRNVYANGFENKGEPIILTEFGGIGFELAGEDAWGYCYTQLTDVEQEMNGLLTYDRRPKCDLKKIAEINGKYHRKQ